MIKYISLLLFLLLTTTIFASYNGGILIQNVQAETFNLPNEIELGEGLRMYIVNTNTGFPNNVQIISGGLIKVSIGVQNTGTEPLTNGVITIPVPPNFIDLTSSDCDISEDIITCIVGDLSPGQPFPPSGSLVDIIATIDPDSTSPVAKTTTTFCADNGGDTFCVEDRGASLVIFPDPEPITLSLDVTGMQFTISWEQPFHTEFVDFSARYIVMEPDGTISEDWQPLEKTCPINQGQCGPFDFSIVNSVIRGQYIHTHQFEALLNHCFEITSNFNTFESQIITACALTEFVEPPIHDDIPLLDKIAQMEQLLDEIKILIGDLQTELDELNAENELLQSQLDSNHSAQNTLDAIRELLEL